MRVTSIYVVWAKYSRRAETLANKLGGQAYFLYESELERPWFVPLRYLVRSWKTWRLLECEKPDVVLVQTPPIFAPLVVAMWCMLRGKNRVSGDHTGYVIDCHTSTFYRYDWNWAMPILRLLAQRAEVLLCHNEGALAILRDWKVKGIFLSDGIPTLDPPTGVMGSEGETRVGVIGSLYSDEPIAEVFAAARLLPQVTFYVAGESKRLKAQLLAQKPANIILTGFLQGGDFTSLLKNMHGLVILTNQPKALNCAAYEAVVMEKPTVVSDWQEMRAYFTHGFIYVKNTPDEIAVGVARMLQEQTRLTSEIITMRSLLETEWQAKFAALVTLLSKGREQEASWHEEQLVN